MSVFFFVFVFEVTACFAERSNKTTHTASDIQISTQNYALLPDDNIVVMSAVGSPDTQDITRRYSDYVKRRCV